MECRKTENDIYIYMYIYIFFTLGTWVALGHLHLHENIRLSLRPLTGNVGIYNGGTTLEHSAMKVYTLLFLCCNQHWSDVANTRWSSTAQKAAAGSFVLGSGSHCKSHLLLRCYTASSCMIAIRTSRFESLSRGTM